MFGMIAGNAGGWSISSDHGRYKINEDVNEAAVGKKWVVAEITSGAWNLSSSSSKSESKLVSGAESY